MNILITGAGGVGGVNFCRALNFTKKYRLIGTDYFKYHRIFPDVDVIIPTPRHRALEFIPTLRKIVKKYKIEFLHPNPTLEALEVSMMHKFHPFVKTLLPKPEIIHSAFNKMIVAKKLAKNNVSVPKIYDIFSDNIEFPVWIRAIRGAGGLRSLHCYEQNDLDAWLSIWKTRKIHENSFFVQKYINGRDIAWDSLWYKGKLITSFSRERLEYPFRRLGRGGTPTVAKIIHDKKINEVGEKAVLTIDSNPNGFYCVDLMYDEKQPYVTEVNVGKAHTTLSLWSYGMSKYFKKSRYNIPDIYIKLGTEQQIGEQQKFDLFPKGYYLIRYIDCGSWLWKEDNGRVVKVRLT